MRLRFSNCNLPPYPEADIKAAENAKWAALAGECVTRKMTKEEVNRYGKAISKPCRKAFIELDIPVFDSNPPEGACPYEITE